MPPLSRRARRVALAGACMAALAAGALPVLLTSHNEGRGAVDVKAAGSVAANPDDLAIAPGDPTPPDTATPSTTVATAEPTTTTAQPVTTTTTITMATTPTSTTVPGGIATCGPNDLRINAATDRSTYRPGDLITVSVQLGNRSQDPCLFSDPQATAHTDTCSPSVIFTRVDQSGSGTPMDSLATWYATGCDPGPVALTPGEVVTRRVQGTFQARNDCASGTSDCVLRPGQWQGIVGWNYVGSDGSTRSLTAMTFFTCPDDACPPAPSTSSTSTTTASSSSSTTTTTY